MNLIRIHTREPASWVFWLLAGAGLVRAIYHVAIAGLAWTVHHVERHYTNGHEREYDVGFVGNGPLASLFESTFADGLGDSGCPDGRRAESNRIDHAAVIQEHLK
jgi:hypothetical protein